MKESFNTLYTRLYKENFSELEEIRKVEKAKFKKMFVPLAVGFLLSIVNPFFMVIGLIIMFVNISKENKAAKNSPNTKDYKQLFKEKIIGPIIENEFPDSKYNYKEGFTSYEYDKAGFRDYEDRYHSDDKVLAPFNVAGEIRSFITFAEVHTERRSKDSDGDVTYSTIFNGLVATFPLPKNIGTKVYIKSNGSAGLFNKNRVKMDMPEFEKIFDVESQNPIVTMQILTADVMADMIDLYTKYKYKFEVNIFEDTAYMRLRTGSLFEPDLFGSSMDCKLIAKYYTILKSLTNISEHIYETIQNLDI